MILDKINELISTLDQSLTKIEKTKLLVNEINGMIKATHDDVLKPKLSAVLSISNECPKCLKMTYPPRMIIIAEIIDKDMALRKQNKNLTESKHDSIPKTPQGIHQRFMAIK